MKMDCLSPVQMESLRRLSSCVVASAIERFGVRLLNAGFTNPRIRSIFEDLPPMVGYAVTARIRTAEPPMEGRSYYEHTNWWNHILSIPEPRVVVIEDLDTPPGVGAFIGEVQTHILLKLGCVGVVTNGTVRDLNLVKPTGFQMFARGPVVSHAYSHVVDFGGKVSVDGMDVRPGELIHGDRHGVQTIPAEIAAEVPQMAQAVLKRRQRLVGLCNSTDFSVERLRKAIEETEDFSICKI
jgi:4-hydroxy-4-methyl-2-oxoglutarate aldolase